MNIEIKYGLPFVEVELGHKGISKRLKNFLIDTGSASTLLSIEFAVQLGLGPELDDSIVEVVGIGGKEFVYEKVIDSIKLDLKEVNGFKIQVGDMDYGFEMDGIIGFDLLKFSKALINLSKMRVE